MSKGNFVPLGVQPDSFTIVVAYRNSSYKKRVTWFNSEPVIATGPHATSSALGSVFLMLIISSILSYTAWYNVSRSSRVNVSPDLPWSLTVLNPISLHFITYRAGIYGKMSKGNFVPLGLQPDSSTIVVAYRKYSISTPCWIPSRRIDFWWEVKLR
jgi:hypothetical protein